MKLSAFAFLLGLGLCACALDTEIDSELSAAAVDRFAINAHPSETHLRGSGRSNYALCDHLSNGVVSMWELDEINAFDFRASRTHCTEISANGWSTGFTDWQDNFRHTGPATTLSASFPVDMLPTGVRVKMAPILGVLKLSDAAFLYNDANSIFAGHTGSIQGNWATGRTRGTVSTLRCSPGYVVTGLDAKEYQLDTLAKNRSDIVGVEIRCRELVRRPINPIPDPDPEQIEPDPQG